ncbi:leucine-rich PPR motif-containing protein, mitochondrial isoform X2 [Cryptotermes secundus]|uniref:leucine-rich PPR motif-containing protein, mitochondrial isoform X2 n=1 Tax=Cryptotermes secundus TaxID=105785 RepID=UPI000CD7B257|nr:leucine-rich PPR motif-containing protein, mitochondrial isoform X2 [Cryptotermes secundus]
MFRSLTTQAVPSHSHNDSNLDRSLRRLDQDVRRIGRITRRELEDVLEELRHAKSATSTQSLLIIRCCGNLVPEASPEVRTQLVEEIWKTLENIGVPMDVSHYNALLRVYLENEHSFSPAEFLANLEHKGIEPNRVTYQRLISRYCQQGDIEGATRILEFMREKQLPVNENVFNALIMGHSQADDTESASGIIGVMQQAGLEPSADTYTALLCGYAKKGDIDAITKTLEQCDAKDIQLLDRDYMDIIYSLAVNDHLEHVDKLIDRMRQSAGYNQDAVNLILRLVNCGHEDLGYKILLTMPRPSRSGGELGLVGSFFIRQLVNANRPVEKIISICQKLEEENLNPRAIFIAAESSLQSGNIDQACALLHVMKEKNLPLRQHYFWPLLASHRNDRDIVLDIVSRMCTQFNVIVGGETLRDYVIPSLEKTSSDEIIWDLRNAGITIAAAASALVHYRLNMNLIAEAARIATRYRAYYSASLLRRPLVQAYNHTKDRDSFVAILRQIHDSVDRAVLADEDSAVVVPERTEIVGNFILDIANVGQNRVAQIEAILQGLVEQGLCLSNSSAERLQEKLGEELTSQISNLLGKLTSGELVPTTLTRPSALPPVAVDEEHLLKTKKMLEERGEPTRGIKKQLFLLYCRNKDLEKVEQIMKELEADNFVFTGGMYALLSELYAHHDKLEEVWTTIKKLKENEPDFPMDSMKIIKIVTLLVKNDRVQDAVKFLSEQSGDRKLEDRSFQYSTLCWRLLNSLAEQGKQDDLKQVFDALVKYEYIEPNNVLLGPLIKVHLVRDDLTGAVEQFEWCCQKYRATPWKNELACRMIQAEDAVSLQKLTDLSTQVHGEVNSLYDLVFAFVECGRIRQARKILETPGLRSRPQRLNSACERYQQEGKLAPLEGLVEATRDMSHIDRSDIYYHLLLSYCKSEDPDKALGLWTRMQEEDVQPSDQFLSTLGTFLKSKGKEVPFVIPEVVLATEVRKGRGEGHEAEASGATLTATQNFRQALRRNDLDDALIHKHTVESTANESLSVGDLSALVQGLVKADRCGEASKVVLGMMEKGIYPAFRVLRFLMNRLAIAGDIDTLTAIGNLLTPEKKKRVSFDNRFCHANVVAGKAVEYMKTLTEEIENVKDSDLESLAEKFPRGGAIAILENHPELLSDYEQMALKYAARGIKAPINVLWMDLFVKGQDAEAKKLWDEHLAGSSRIMFQHILQEAQEKRDENIARKLIALLQGTAVSEGVRGNAYSCLLDVLVNTEKYDDALVALEEAVKDVCLENMNRATLLRLQIGLQNQGKTFPFEVPPKNAKSSSSSSSDDEQSTIENKQ